MKAWNFTSLVVFLAVALSGWADFYVAPNGSDEDPGTAGRPFRTIQKAADVAEAGETVYVKRGIYRETVIPANSGKAGAPIVFRPYKNDKVVISGCDPVKDWVRVKGDMWKTRASWDVGRGGRGNTLFVNGELKFEAAEGAEGDPLLFKNLGHIPKGRLRSNGFTAPDLKGWGDDYWNGAKVRNHRNDWEIRGNTITDYDSDTGKISFKRDLGRVSQKHVIGYTIYGTLKALDKPGEWFKAGDVLYYQVEPGQNPNKLWIELKRRANAFDVANRDHIEIRGFTLRGAGIRANGNTDHTVIAGNRIYGFDRANQGRLSMSGKDNVIRDNEISHTWETAVYFGGEHNSLINNFIHDIGYGGTTRVVRMDGSFHLVSHNTISKISRSFLDGYPAHSEFAYNLFEDGANLSWDTGFFDGDGGRGNGGGCVIHHNVFRNSPAIGIFCAFYAGLDLVVHHNLVYDITPYTVRIGQLQFLKYYHNTWIGAPPRGNTNAKGIAYQSNFNNNLQTTLDIGASLGVDNRGNALYTPEDFVDYKGRDFRPSKGSAAIDAGIVLPGINDGFKGRAPDSGALEYGQPMWAVGHNFKKPPNSKYAMKALAGTNIYGNGQFRRAPEGWTTMGSPKWFNGNAWNTLGHGLSRLSNSIQFEPGDGYSRIFSDLKPNTCYTIAAEVRLSDQVIEMEQYSKSQGDVKSLHHRSENYINGLNDGEWVSYKNIDFGAAGQYDHLELIYTRPIPMRHKPEGASLEVRLDSPEGVLLAEFTYNPAVVDSWDIDRSAIPELTGKHTVYALAKGAKASEIRLASMRLYNSAMQPDDKLSFTARGFDGSNVTTCLGDYKWRLAYEEFTFVTGPAGTSVEIVIENNGPHDAYMDRFALYEKIDPTEKAKTAVTRQKQSSLFDLGRSEPIYGIKVTAAKGGLGAFSVALADRDPENSENTFWKSSFLTHSPRLNARETYFITAVDSSSDGLLQLQNADARYVRLDLAKGDAQPAVEVLLFDEKDLVLSDGSVKNNANTWQVAFPQIVNFGEVKIEGLRSKEFKISVWDREPSRNGKVLWEKSYTARGNTFAICGDELSVDGQTRLASALGRVVRVESTSQLDYDRISLKDSVHVKPASNIAMYGIASQVKDMYSNTGRAELAINGTALPQGEFTSTPPMDKPWWQVELPWAAKIDQIVVYNRQDCPDRLGEFRVSVWDANPEAGGKELWGKDYSYKNGDLPAGGKLVINESDTSNGIRLDQVEAAVIRVQLHGHNLLSLPEVQVWAATTK